MEDESLREARYGDNGTGKPCFVRVLKSACRSRDEKTAILRDVNAAGDISQSGHIDFEVAGRAETYDWHPEHGDHADLPAASIFDARNANIHVQKPNNVAYLPFAMALLDRLGRACDELRVLGSLAWDPDPAFERGPTLTVRQTLSASAAGGADALLGRQTLDGLAANDDGFASRRLERRSRLGDRLPLQHALSARWRCGLAHCKNFLLALVRTLPTWKLASRSGMLP